MKKNEDRDEFYDIELENTMDLTNIIEEIKQDE